MLGIPVRNPPLHFILRLIHFACLWHLDSTTRGMHHGCDISSFSYSSKVPQPSLFLNKEITTDSHGCRHKTPVIDFTTRFSSQNSWGYFCLSRFCEISMPKDVTG